MILVLHFLIRIFNICNNWIQKKKSTVFVSLSYTFTLLDNFLKINKNVKIILENLSLYDSNSILSSYGIKFKEKINFHK